MATDGVSPRVSREGLHDRHILRLLADNMAVGLTPLASLSCDSLAQLHLRKHGLNSPCDISKPPVAFTLLYKSVSHSTPSSRCCCISHSRHIFCRLSLVFHSLALRQARIFCRLSAMNPQGMLSLHPIQTNTLTYMPTYMSIVISFIIDRIYKTYKNRKQYIQ